MKRMIVLVAVTGLTLGCSRKASFSVQEIETQVNCTVDQLPDGVLITCPDGTSASLVNNTCPKIVCNKHGKKCYVQP